MAGLQVIPEGRARHGLRCYNDPVGLLLKDTLGSAKTLKAVLGRITPVKSCHVQLDGKQYNRADAERLEDNAGRCKFTPLVVCNRGAH
jgi:hypothetical protein